MPNQMPTRMPKKEKVTAPGEMLSVAEVAPKLGLRVSTVRAWLLLRKIPFVKLSARCVRIPRLEVEKLIRDRSIPAREASHTHD
jgi:excisionase family DNA binding protein